METIQISHEGNWDRPVITLDKLAPMRSGQTCWMKHDSIQSCILSNKGQAHLCIRKPLFPVPAVFCHVAPSAIYPDHLNDMRYTVKAVALTVSDRKSFIPALLKSVGLPCHKQARHAATLTCTRPVNRLTRITHDACTFHATADTSYPQVDAHMLSQASVEHPCPRTCWKFLCTFM